eukprot:IDg12307t1
MQRFLAQKQAKRRCRRSISSSSTQFACRVWYVTLAYSSESSGFCGKHGKAAHSRPPHSTVSMRFENAMRFMSVTFRGEA